MATSKINSRVKRYTKSLNTSGTTSVNGLSKASFAFVLCSSYGSYKVLPIDIDSLGTPFQLYVSADTWVQLVGNKANETITVQNTLGFESLEIVYYCFE